MNQGELFGKPTPPEPKATRERPRPPGRPRAYREGCKQCGTLWSSGWVYDPKGGPSTCAGCASGQGAGSGAIRGSQVRGPCATCGVAYDGEEWWFLGHDPGPKGRDLCPDCAWKSATGRLAVETVRPGEKGEQRFRSDPRVKRWLKAKRPNAGPDHAGRDEAGWIVTYRTEACVAYNLAAEAGAAPDVLAFLAGEHEWAMERLRVLDPETAAHLEAWAAQSDEDEMLDSGSITTDQKGE